MRIKLDENLAEGLAEPIPRRKQGPPFRVLR